LTIFRLITDFIAPYDYSLVKIETFFLLIISDPLWETLKK